MSGTDEAGRVSAKTKRSAWAGVLLGVGLMAAVDEIVFHQLFSPALEPSSSSKATIWPRFLAMRNTATRGLWSTQSQWRPPATAQPVFVHPHLGLRQRGVVGLVPGGLQGLAGAPRARWRRCPARRAPAAPRPASAAGRGARSITLRLPSKATSPLARSPRAPGAPGRRG